MASSTPTKVEPTTVGAGDAATGNAQTTPGPDASEQQQHDDTEPAGRRGKKRLGVDPSLILSEGRSKRRKTPTPDPEDGHDEHDGGGSHDPKDPERAKRLGYGIYNRIMGEKTKEGDSLAEPFVKLPNKRAFPDYYETIKVPMSLEIVHQRLEDGSYDTLKAVVADIGQIFNNAKRYNVKESVIFQYAKKLHKITRVYFAANTQPDAPAPAPVPAPAPAPTPTVVPKVEDPKPSASASMEASTSRGAEPDTAGPSGASADGGEAETTGTQPGSGRFRKRGSYMKDGPTVYKLVKPILKAIKEANSREWVETHWSRQTTADLSGSGRQIAGIFMELPDRRIFTDYYRTIKEPISLKEIEASAA